MLRLLALVLLLASTVRVLSSHGWRFRCSMFRSSTRFAGEAFAAGFVLVGTCALIGKAVGSILAVIKR